MADRDFGWRDRDYFDYEGRYGREGYRGANREGSSRPGPYEGGRGGYGDYGEFRGYGPYGENRGYGGVGGFGAYGREYDRLGESPGYGGYGGYGTSSSRFYGSSWDRGAYGGFGDRQGTAIGRPNYSGRGPKNWKRSDERIIDDINERLARDPDLDATDVDVRVSNGVVTLAGVVEDRGEKRRAEDIAEDVFGVDDVHNELKVRHGFLSRLTGEHADEREVTRSTEREAAGTASGMAASGTRNPSTRPTSRT